MNIYGTNGFFIYLAIFHLLIGLFGMYRITKREYEDNPDSTKAVDDFHASALKNGGVNEGLPGLRSDGNYYAYIRDPEGNKICAKCNSK